MLTQEQVKRQSAHQVDMNYYRGIAEIARNYDIGIFRAWADDMEHALHNMERLGHKTFELQVALGQMRQLSGYIQHGLDQAMEGGAG